jgi:hypothetical protein
VCLSASFISNQVFPIQLGTENVVLKLSSEYNFG